MNGFVLTRENYYSAAANRAYMSCSTYDAYLSCEAAALAKEQGRHRSKPSRAFVLGNYFHTAFESAEAHREYCEQNAEGLFTLSSLKPGKVPQKRADVEQMDDMIRTMLGDPLMRRLVDMPGENELAMAGEIFGIPWKVRMDKLCPGHLIIDYKTCADIWETTYDPIQQRRVTFVERYGYTRRAAVYREIYRQRTGVLPSFLLLCVSKQDPPDKEAIMIASEQLMAYELEQIKEHIGRIQRVRDLSVKPTRCGACEYCRRTKILKAIKTAADIDPEFRQREEEYDELWHPRAGALISEIPATA